MRLLSKASTSPEAQERDCCAGCNFCCYMPVDVTSPEAITIADHLKATRSDEEVDDLKERLRAAETRIRPFSLIEHTKTLVRCELLGEDGLCSIYEVRPLACIGFTSKSRSACEDMFNNPSDLSICAPQDVHTKLWTAATATALKSALFARARDGASYELHSAVRAALEEPKAAQRWGDGECVFRDCISREPDLTSPMGQPPTTRAMQPGSGKVGRNAPCPCGSGRKYKKCCGRS